MIFSFYYDSNICKTVKFVESLKSKKKVFHKHREIIDSNLPPKSNEDLRTQPIYQ